MTWRSSMWQGKLKVVLGVIVFMIVFGLITIVRDDSESQASRIAGAAFIAVALVVIVIMSNWIKVDSSEVRFGFVPFYWKTVAYNEIRTVSVVAVGGLRKYWGYGLRGWPTWERGMLIGGAHERGVRIETTDNRRYVLSFPDADVNAIMPALQAQGCTLAAEPGEDRFGST